MYLGASSLKIYKTFALVSEFRFPNNVIHVLSTHHK